MSFVLLSIGAILLIAAIRDTQDSLFTLAKGDFTGPANFIYWALSILIIGALGYIPKLKALSVAFLVLVILVLVLKRGDPNAATGGFFQKFFQQIGSTNQPSATTNQTSTGSAAASTVPFLSSLLG